MPKGFSDRAQALAGLGGAKWELHFAAQAKVAAGEDILALSIGEPEVPPPALMAEAAKAALDRGRIGYTNGPGEPELRQRLAARYTRRTGRSFETDQILVTSGTQNALYLALQTLAGPGDEVLVTDPLYATYEGLVRASGATPVFVPLHPDRQFHLATADVVAAITPRTVALLLNSPHNPTGAVLSAAEIAAIGALATQHDFWLISDEVYEELVFDGVAFASALDDPALADRTVAVASLSKSHAAAGYRAGWLVGPSDFCAAALPLTETELFGLPPFIQDAAAAVLAQGPSTIAPTMRANYARRARLVHDGLDGVGGLRVMRPAAGMFALVDVRGRQQTGLEFGQHLFDAAGVAVMPGDSFGSVLAGFIRVSLTVEDTQLQQALDRIRSVL